MTTISSRLRRSELQLQRAARIPWQSLQGLLLDWAGTMIDHGSLAPVEVVRTVFAEFNIQVTEAEARQPMGKAKIDHLREVLNMPRVAQAWQQTNGQVADETVVQEIYQRFLVLQKAVLAKHAELIPGAVEFVQFARSLDLRIGSTTGYTRELMEVLLPLAASRGYSPDATICSDEVRSGRPAPWSNFRAAELIDVYPMDSILAVDDSIAGIQAAKHAGCYAVAVTTTGNPFGLTVDQLSQLDEAELMRRHQKAELEFYEAGADLVVESVAVLHELWSRFMAEK